MSIRLRLTLLYSAILALTLLIFGVALYSIQASDTLNALKLDLVLGSEKLVEAALRADPAGQPPNDHRRNDPPKTFDEFSGEQAFQDLREREIVRILDAEGNLLASPFGRQEDALPLSAAGLAAAPLPSARPVRNFCTRPVRASVSATTKAARAPWVASKDCADSKAMRARLSPARTCSPISPARAAS